MVTGKPPAIISLTLRPGYLKEGYSHKHLVDPSLKGIYPNVMDHKPYKYMTLESESGAAE